MKKIISIICSLFLIISCSVKEEQSMIINDQATVYYEIYVGSFCDSNNDGIGDLKGVTSKLAYLKNLGVSGIWLMPISKSNTYHKYDVLDYKSIDPDFGTEEDFQELVQKAKELNIDVIVDLVLNHTSSDHPWFKEASTAIINDQCSTNDYCEYYNFSLDKQVNYEGLNEKWYYEAVFWSKMPDLNLDSLKVKQEISEIVDYWLAYGIKGFRLDAPYHYYSGNISKNNEFLTWFNQEVKSKKPDAYIVGEVWSDETTIINHYDSNIPSLFNFPISDTNGLIIQAIRKNSGADLAKWVVDHQQQLLENAQDANFISNHDQSRSAGFLGSFAKRKLAASLYILMPGIPFIYYGEEIGLKGSGIDENKRLPMLWGEGNDCAVLAQATYDKQVDTSVKEQLADPDSLLAYYQSLVQTLQRHPELQDKQVTTMGFNHPAIYALNHQDKIIVVSNLQQEKVTVRVNGDYRLEEITANSAKLENEQLTVNPYETILLIAN